MRNHGLHRLNTQIIPNVVTHKSFTSGSRSVSKAVTTFGTQIIILATCYLLLATFSYAQTISSAELINNAKQYDGKTVIYEGEVIGDIMLRGEFGWANLNDGQNAIGIWMPKDFAETIEHKGSYSSKGDWIKIGGEFHRSCLEHGGDLDIHAKSIVILKKGKPVQEIINSAKQKAVLIFLGVAICLGILKILIDKYRKS